MPTDTSTATSPDRTGLFLPVLALGAFATFTNAWLFGPLLLPLSEEFGVSVPLIGQVATGVAIVWGTAGPTAGPLSDRYGRRPVLAGGLLLIAFSCLGVSLAWDYMSLLAFRLLAAAGSGAFFPVCMATVGDWFPSSRRGRAMSWVMMAQPTASLIGVPMMLLVAQAVGWRWSFLVTGALAVIVCLVVLWALPRGRPAGAVSFGFFAGYREGLRARSALSLLTANSIAQAGYSGLNLYLPAYLMQAYSLNIGQIAPVLSLVALGSIAGSMLGGMLADRVRRVRLYALSQIVQGSIGLPLLTLAPGVLLSGFLAGAYGGFQYLGRPAYAALIVGLSARARGTMSGLNAISNQSGMAAGTGVGGLALSLGGYGAVAWLSTAACFLGAGLLLRVPRDLAEPVAADVGDVAAVER